MSNISKQALLVENNQSFPNNTAGLITPNGLRTFNENMIDSNVNQTVYTTDSASFDNRIDALSGSAQTTGSLLETASFNNNTRNLTFTKGDSSTFAVNIPDVSGSILPAGLVSGSSQINYPQISNIPVGIVSGSGQIIPLLPTGVVSGSTQVLGGTGIVSSSAQINYTGISNIPTGIVSGSSQLTASYDLRYELSGSAVVLPGGLVSSSAQINYPQISNIPAGIVSGSSQITNLGFVSASVTGSSLTTASLSGNTITFTKGDSSTFGFTIPDVSGSDLPSGVVSGSSQINYPQISNIPSGIVSGSSQLTASYDLRYELSGSVTPLPSGIVSSSQQITDLGFVSSSVTGSSLTTASFSGNTLTFTKGDTTTFGVVIPDVSGSDLPSGVVSGSSQINYPQISNIPAGIVSGSSQVSYPLLSNIPGGIISGSGQLTGSFVTLTGVQTITGPKTFQQAIGGSINAIEMFDAAKIQFGGFSKTRIGTIGGKNLVIESTNGDGANTINIVAGVSGNQGSLGGANTIVIQALGNQVGNNLTLRAPNIIISGSTNISGSLSHSLQEGFVLVGDSSGRTTNVATSSFGTNLNTGSFATTGSNTFIGNQIITGSLEVSETVKSQVYINPQTIDGFTIPTGNNAMLVGTIGISGSIVVEGNSNLIVLDQVTLPSGVVSGSSQLTASYDVRYELSGSGGGPIETGSFATTGSNSFIGNQIITGSLLVSSSDAITLIISGSKAGGIPTPNSGVFLDSNLIVKGDVRFDQAFRALACGLRQIFPLPANVGGNGKLTIEGEVIIHEPSGFLASTNLGVSGSIIASGSVNVGVALALTPNDPLPANGVGKLAVSGSNLFFNDGSNWILVV